jgi:hypothetical protein
MSLVECNTNGGIEMTIWGTQESRMGDGGEQGASDALRCGMGWVVQSKEKVGYLFLDAFTTDSLKGVHEQFCYCETSIATFLRSGFFYSHHTPGGKEDRVHHMSVLVRNLTHCSVKRKV